MNISEANAVNDVLTLLLQPGGRSVTEGDAWTAAEMLAERAYKALSAGLRGDEVTRLWPQALLDGRAGVETAGPITVAELRRTLTGEAADG